MDIIVIGAFLFSGITLMIVSVGSFYLVKQVKMIHKRIDSIFTIDKPAPNDKTMLTDNPTQFEEPNFYNVAPNVKLDVEGGDSQVPPGFKEQ